MQLAALRSVSGSSAAPRVTVPGLRIVLAVILALLPMSGPFAAAPAAAQTPSTLVIDTTAEAESLDPALVTQFSGNSIMNSVFDSLIERDYTGALVPMLAESWSFPDPSTIEFKLRQGVVFQNGEPFNAASVKFSIERLLDPALSSPLAGGWPKAFQLQPTPSGPATGSIEIVDDYTVRFHLAQPDATIFDALATSGAMLPPQYYSQNPEDVLSTKPVGSGPFTFVESVRDDHTTLARNPSYWGVDTYKGTPLVPTVVFRPVPDAGTRMADLLNGTADMIFDVSPDDLSTLRGRAGDGFQVVTGNASAKLQFVEFLPKKATDPLADRRVRQALNHAVNVEAIVTNLFNGLGTRQSSPILTEALGYDPSVPAYDYTPTFAKQLLADAGYPNGFSTTMDLSSSDNRSEALAVIGQLQQVGVTVQPNTLELATFNTNWTQDKSSDLRFARWGGLQDPAVFLNFTTVCGGYLADQFACDKDATTLAQQAATTLDPSVRAGLYSRVARLLNDDPMGIYLANDVSIYGVGPRVSGWRGPTGRDFLIPTNITLQ
jgi:peptide/nickel transport system substrate-binding protein